VKPKEGLTPLPAGEGASKLYVLDAATGKLVGDFQVMNRVCSAVAIVDGVLYFGSYDGCVYAITHDDQAEALAADFRMEVKTEVVSEVTSDPAAGTWYEKRTASWPMSRHDSQRTGVAGTSLDPKGLALLWSKELGPKVRSSAAIVEGRIYVGSDDGHVFCLDPRDGKVVWKFKTCGTVRSSPALWENRV
jgi:eukaryotic-like serine/threonine-protein kinase